MKKTLLAAAAIAAFATSARAEITTYACRVEAERDHVFALKIDHTKRTMTWRGETFRNLREFADDGSGEECAKYCYVATNRGHRAFVSTATQGVANLELSRADSAPENHDCDRVNER